MTLFFFVANLSSICSIIQIKRDCLTCIVYLMCENEKLIIMDKIK